jgi:parallel beta-helix repeat protein
MMAFMLLVASLSPVSPAFANETQGACQLPNGGNVSGNVKLERGCVYNQTLTVSESNSKVDCDGATLDGENRLKYGVMVVSNGKSLSDVSVSNCNVRNFSVNGVMVGSGIPDFKRSGDHQHNYDITPSNVVLSHLHVQDSGSVGVYFYSYVADSTLRDSVVSGSKGVGIYLEQSSKGNKIVDNVIKANGVVEGGGPREGIAVDSSAGNLIEGNSFFGNAAGGVFLYKNCGENFDKGMAVLRWQHSNENVIRNNRFFDEKVGVWVASRQGRDLSQKGCGDSSLDGRGQYYRDYADYNVVEGNQFCRSKNYIVVSGNYNQIKNNRSDAATSAWVEQPVTMTARITGEPTVGNVIEGNVYEACK